MNPKVSVIVPVYNVEKYLKKSISSILNQTLEDIEIIIINDGSTDNSYKIVKELAEYDSRIVVINKENGGVSSARNIGLRVAKGEYISFVDSDDWIDRDMIIDLYYIAKQYRCDVISCSYDINEKRKVEYPLTANKLMRREDIIREIFPKIIGGNIKTFIWDKIYNREFIIKNNIEFDEEIDLFEDWVFLVSVYEYMSDFYYISKCMYHYRLNNNSLSNKYHENFYDLIINIHRRKLQFINKVKLNTSYNNLIARNNFISDLIKSINHVVINGEELTLGEKKKQLDKILLNDFNKQILIGDINEYLDNNSMNYIYGKYLLKLIENKRSFFIIIWIKSYLLLKNIRN